MRLADFRKNERRDDRGNDAEFDFRETENCVGARNDDIADGGKACASTESRAVNLCDNGFAASVDRTKHIRHRARILDVFFMAQIQRGAHPIDVGAAAKHFALTRKNDRPDRRITREAVERFTQSGNQFGVEGVSDIGPREDDASQTAFGGNGEYA